MAYRAGRRGTLRRATVLTLIALFAGAQVVVGSAVVRDGSGRSGTLDSATDPTGGSAVASGARQAAMTLGSIRRTGATLRDMLASMVSRPTDRPVSTIADVIAATPTCFGQPATRAGTAGNDVINGTAGADVIVGLGGNDQIRGYGGNDLICAGDGNDVITPGAGDDRVNGGSGIDSVSYATASVGVDVSLGTTSAQPTGQGADSITGVEGLVGSPYADRLEGSAGANALSGAGGNDTLLGRGGDDSLLGGGGNDALYGATGNDTLRGGPGSDSLFGGAGSDVLVGGGSGSSICGGTGNDKLYGQAGIDILVEGPGNDLLDGGIGDPLELDLAFYACASTGVTVSLGTGSSSGDGADTLTGVDGIVGSFHDDTLVGNDGFNLYAGLDGDDQIDGKGGFDIALFLTASAGVNVDLGAGTAAGEGADALSGVESAYGTDLADVLAGDADANLLIGAGGNDTITGNGGDDVISGGDGNDGIAGGGGNDLLFGDGGNDSISGGAGTADVASYTTAPGPITANLALGTASGEGADTLSGVENIVGSTFDDVLSGDGASNRIYGIGGSDTLNGAGGADFLYGGQGNDQLHGGSGADFLDGGDGTADVDDGGPDPDACIGGETTVNCEGDGTGSSSTSPGFGATPPGGVRSAVAVTGRSRPGPAAEQPIAKSSVPLVHSNNWFTYTNPSTQCASTTSLVTDMPAGVTVDNAAGGQEWIWYQSYLYSTADPATELQHSEYFYSPQQPGYQTTKSWYRYTDNSVDQWTVSFTTEPTHDYYVVFQLWWQDGNANFFATERYRAEEALGLGAFGQYCPASMAYITIGGAGYGSMAYNCQGLDESSCAFYLGLLEEMNNGVAGPWVQ